MRPFLSGQKIPIDEYTKTNSIYSSMRLAFLKVVRFWIILTFVIVLSIIGTAIASSFTTKPIVLPVAALIGVIATVGTIAFGGKAIQSFSEPDAPETDTMKKEEMIKKDVLLEAENTTTSDEGR